MNSFKSDNKTYDRSYLYTQLFLYKSVNHYTKSEISLHVLDDVIDSEVVDVDWTFVGCNVVASVGAAGKSHEND